jgi:predicted nucleic acid-binding protein
LRIAFDSAILVRANQRATGSARALLLEVLDLVEPDETVAPPIRDPDDIHVIQMAVAGQADYLCTLDAHFYDPTVLAFCLSKGVRVITDVELLRLIRAASSK